MNSHQEANINAAVLALGNPDGPNAKIIVPHRRCSIAPEAAPMLGFRILASVVSRVGFSGHAL